MDPNKTPVQSAQNKTQSAQPVTTVQPQKQPTESNLPTALTQPQTQTPSSISVDKEGPTAVIAETADSEAGSIEVKPSTPEFSAKPEVGEFAEKSSDQEKPELSKQVQDAGVTHSGPGVIDVAQNSFGVTKMPAKTFTQAAEDEKKAPFNDSKHWFSAMIMYIWRKIKPKEADKKEG